MPWRAFVAARIFDSSYTSFSRTAAIVKHGNVQQPSTHERVAAAALRRAESTPERVVSCVVGDRGRALAGRWSARAPTSFGSSYSLFAPLAMTGPVDCAGGARNVAMADGSRQSLTGVPSDVVAVASLSCDNDRVSSDMTRMECQHLPAVPICAGQQWRAIRQETASR